MLRQHTLSAKRALRLLSNPVPDAGPAKDMTACRDTRILHRLEAERALPLLASVNPLHNLFVLKIVPRGLEDGRMRDLLQSRPIDGWRVGRFEEQRVVGGIRIRVERDLDTVIEDGSPADGRADVGYRHRAMGQGVVNVQVRLHCKLQHEQHSENFIPDALARRLNGTRKDVSKPEKALSDMIIRAAEVEDSQTDRVDGRGRSDSVEIGEDVGL